MFDKETLKSPGILHTNFFISREHRNVRTNYLDALYRGFMTSIEEEEVRLATNGVNRGLIDLQLTDTTEDFLKSVNNLGLNDFRRLIAYNIANLGGISKIPRVLSESAGERIEKNIRKLSEIASRFEQIGVPRSVTTYLMAKLSNPYFLENLDIYSYNQ